MWHQTFYQEVTPKVDITIGRALREESNTIGNTTFQFLFWRCGLKTAWVMTIPKFDLLFDLVTYFLDLFPPPTNLQEPGPSVFIWQSFMICLLVLEILWAYKLFNQQTWQNVIWVSKNHQESIMSEIINHKHHHLSSSFNSFPLKVHMITMTISTCNLPAFQEILFLASAGNPILLKVCTGGLKDKSVIIL